MAFVSLLDFEEYAFQKLEKNAFDYYKSGAGEQFTLRVNSEAFQSLRIRPRCLRDVSRLDTRCEVVGQLLKWPLGIAPVAMQKMAHAAGEIGSARAAGLVGSIFILSTLSTTSIEDLAEHAPDTCKWFQLYIHKDRKYSTNDSYRALTEQLVRRAEQANFKALAVTIDAPLFGQRRADVRNRFRLPGHLRLANLDGERATGVVSAMGGSGLNEYVINQFDPSITWQDIKWLKQLTTLPIVVKGVLTAEDAEIAREYGCTGIIVSNHGGRQLDTTPATIEALPEVVNAVGNDLVVMLDGGITKGIDIFKSIALGAKMVFIGRPVVWGLACNGQRGVEQVLEILKGDFDITMALAGCQTLADINSCMVKHKSTYWRS